MSPVTPYGALTANAGRARIRRIVPRFSVSPLSALVKAACEEHACRPSAQTCVRSARIEAREDIAPSQVRQHSCRMGCEQAAKGQGLRRQRTAPSAQAHDRQPSEGWWKCWLCLYVRCSNTQSDGGAKQKKMAEKDKWRNLSCQNNAALHLAAVTGTCGTAVSRPQVWV